MHREDKKKSKEKIKTNHEMLKQIANDRYFKKKITPWFYPKTIYKFNKIIF